MSHWAEEQLREIERKLNILAVADIATLILLLILFLVLFAKPASATVYVAGPDGKRFGHPTYTCPTTATFAKKANSILTVYTTPEPVWPMDAAIGDSFTLTYRCGDGLWSPASEVFVVAPAVSTTGKLSWGVPDLLRLKELWQRHREGKEWVRWQ